MGEEALVIDQELDEQTGRPAGSRTEADKGTDEKPDESRGKDDEKRSAGEFHPEQQAGGRNSAPAAARNLKVLEERKRARQQLEAEGPKLRLQQQAQSGGQKVPRNYRTPSDDFDAKMQQRDEEHCRGCPVGTPVPPKQHQDAQRKAKEEAEQAELEKKTVTAYQNPGAEAGYQDAELQVSGRPGGRCWHGARTCATHLHDAQGPALTVYLANHIEELDRSAACRSIGAAIYIETQIKPKLTKPGIDPHPAPAGVCPWIGPAEGKLGGKGPC